jgi:hypothetical protein
MRAIFKQQTLEIIIKNLSCPELSLCDEIKVLSFEISV